MQLKARMKLNTDIPDILDELSKYLVEQTTQYLGTIKTVRLWEKSLPLWTVINVNYYFPSTTIISPAFARV